MPVPAAEEVPSAEEVRQVLVDGDSGTLENLGVRLRQG